MVSSQGGEYQFHENSLPNETSRYKWNVVATYPNDPDCAWLSGSPFDNVGKILTTRDGGRSWQQVSPSDQISSWLSIYPIDTERVWIAGQDREGPNRIPAIMLSLDGGDTWEREERGYFAGENGDMFYSICFGSTGSGIAVGAAGAPNVPRLCGPTTGAAPGMSWICRSNPMSNGMPRCAGTIDHIGLRACRASCCAGILFRIRRGSGATLTGSWFQCRMGPLPLYMPSTHRKTGTWSGLLVTMGG